MTTHNCACPVCKSTRTMQSANGYHICRDCGERWENPAGVPVDALVEIADGKWVVMTIRGWTGRRVDNN